MTHRAPPFAGQHVRFAGSITHLSSADRGAHVVTGSHGGTLVGEYALRRAIASLVCHDAGVGLKGAGVASLALLDAAGVPAVAIAHTSARIGEPKDMARRGIVSRANDAARKLGIVPEMPCGEAIDRLAASEHRRRGDEFVTPGAPPSRRHLLGVLDTDMFRRPPEVFCLDSASEITEADAGKVVITGSHGGLPGGDAKNAIKALVGLVGFNDAGIGIDEAGVARLAALDDLGVGAFAVAAGSARIGDGLSTFTDGTVSRVNERARTLGIAPGVAVSALLQLRPPISDRHRGRHASVVSQRG